LPFRPRHFWNRITLVLATGFGIGLIPVMPGTFGTLLGLPLACLLSRPEWPLGVRAALEGVILLAGIPICGKAARLFGRPDPGSVVYDEIAALPLVFLPVPFSLTTAVLGFIWFRVFDILKPWPVHYLERFPGGLGIMIDDVAAALYGALALWASVALWSLLAGH
jgi:phosphatidylglycerophosphatase A